MTSSTRSRGYLPHLETQEAIYFVTFRLADSLPRELVIQLRKERDTIENASLAGNTRPSDFSRLRELRALLKKVERCLDRGIGCCHLRDSRVAGHCRRGSPPLSWPALSSVGVVRDAQSRPRAVFPAARAYPRSHSAFLEVVFRSEGKRASRSDGSFLAARVFRSLGSRSVLSSKNHAVHSGQSQKSRAAQLALGRSPFLAISYRRRLAGSLSLTLGGAAGRCRVPDGKFPLLRKFLQSLQA